MQEINSSINAIRKVLLTLIFFSFILLISILGYFIDPDLFASPKVSKVQKAWTPKNINTQLPSDKNNPIRMGYLLVSESSKYIGPMAEDESKRYAGNNLACKNCHLKSGTQAGSGSYVGVANRFPQFRARENKIGTLAERINGCMERSMNGRKMPKNSDEMQSIIAYMGWLSEDVPDSKIKVYKGFPKIIIPEAKANPEIGRLVYTKECTVCHGANGEGKKYTGSDSTKGYLYPPLWGNDTYNHGAGMHRVITAAQFIKANMPFGQATWDNPKLTDEEAYHVAAYINSFERPMKANTPSDFPDKKLKPVSTPYGPWADDFSQEQHKYGPFQPIISYYKEVYDIKKTK